MHFMCVDESVDPVFQKFGSSYFELSGLVISQEKWQTYLDRLKVFRKSLKVKCSRGEVHASELIRINKLKAYRLIRKTLRISILRDYCTQIPVMFGTAKVNKFAEVNERNYRKWVLNENWRLDFCRSHFEFN